MKSRKIVSLILAGTLLLTQVASLTKVEASQFGITENWSVKDLYPIHFTKNIDDNYTNTKWINSVGKATIVTNSKEDSEKYLDGSYFYKNPNFERGAVSTFDEDEYNVVTPSENLIKDTYTLKGKMGLLDNITGELIKPVIYDYIHFGTDEKSKYVAVLKNGKEYSIYNANNDTTLVTKYDFVGDFKKGLSLVKQNNKYGYINTDGNLVIPLKFDSGTYFNKYGVAKVIVDKKYGIINTYGDYVFLPKYGNIDRYTNALISLGDYRNPNNEKNPFKIINVGDEVVYTKSMDKENSTKKLVNYKLSDDGFVVGYNDAKTNKTIHTSISFFDLKGNTIVSNAPYIVSETRIDDPNLVVESNNKLYFLKQNDKFVNGSIFYDLIDTKGNIVENDLQYCFDGEKGWPLYFFADDKIITFVDNKWIENAYYSNFVINPFGDIPYYRSCDYLNESTNNNTLRNGVSPYFTLGYKYMLEPDFYTYRAYSDTNKFKLKPVIGYEDTSFLAKIQAYGKIDFDRNDLLDGRMNLRSNFTFADDLNGEKLLYFGNPDKKHSILYGKNMKYYLASNEKLDENKVYKKSIETYDYVDFTFPEKGDALVVDGNILKNVSILYY